MIRINSKNIFKIYKKKKNDMLNKKKLYGKD